MDTPPTSIRDLARRLLAEEAARRAATDAHETDLVNEKLRISLTRLAGADSFTALLRRARVLSHKESPAPETEKNAADGGMKGSEGHAGHAASGATEHEALVAAHLLWLMVTFIGETLTLRLVRETWPDIRFDEYTGQNRSRKRAA